MHLILFPTSTYRSHVEAALSAFVATDGQPAWEVHDSRSAPTKTFSHFALHGARKGEAPERTLEFPSGTLYREALIAKAQHLAERFTWALCSWNFSYCEGICAFVTEDPGLAEALKQHCATQEQTREWKKRKTLDRLILAHYDGLANFEEQLKGALFFDYGAAGEWAWRRSKLEQNPPYLLLSRLSSEIEHCPTDLSQDQKEALSRCTVVHRKVEKLSWQTNRDYGVFRTSLVISCNHQEAFRTLCGTDQYDDPICGYVLSGLANPKAILRQLNDGNERPLKHPEEERTRIQHSDLHELVRLGETAGWAYSWAWGGGAGEYHGQFWAREPLLTHDLWREITEISETKRSVKPLARF